VPVAQDRTQGWFLLHALFKSHGVFIRCRFFLKRAPFSVSGGELKLEAVRPAYAVLDAFHHGSVDAYSSVTAIIEESRQLQELQDLFELYVSDYLMLQRCSEELLYLKSLWDMVSAAGWLWIVPGADVTQGNGHIQQLFWLQAAAAALLLRGMCSRGWQVCCIMPCAAAHQVNNQFPD
jgi:hypothetical protein